MYFILIFFVELIVLFILSRFVTGGISQLAYRVTRSGNLAVYILSFLFLPGTIIHELSHYFMANLLFVRTGEMEFVPKIHEDRVKLGSVQIEKTDPVRRALIGVAPFIIGSSLLLLILFAGEIYGAWDNIWLSILIVYLLFEVGNTMFSSNRDMEGVIELLVVILIIAFILYFTGVRIPESIFEFLSSTPVTNIFQKGSYYLLIPLGIDILFVAGTRVILRILR